MGSLDSQMQPLKTELSLPEILAHYGKQLDSAGWKPVSNNASSVSGSWSDSSTGQEVTLTITKMPNLAGCYEVSLRAAPRRSAR
jgi:hypothetical protein